MNNKNVNISGKGIIPPGEYNSIKLSGSAMILGDIKCESLNVSGSLKCEGVVDAGMIKTSGSSSFLADVKADEIDASGSFKTTGAISCSKLSASGSLKAVGDINAGKKVNLNGNVVCAGTLSSDEIKIHFSANTDICSVNAENVCIRPEKTAKIFRRFASVTSSIVGDSISLEYVKCPRVIGRVVKIGNGCSIDVVEYSESVDLSSKAKVKKVERTVQ